MIDEEEKEEEGGSGWETERELKARVGCGIIVVAIALFGALGVGRSNRAEAMELLWGRCRYCHFVTTLLWRKYESYIKIRIII